jgi:protein-S-isoprenylcysteine O-methyltransferase Ste14
VTQARRARAARAALGAVVARPWRGGAGAGALAAAAALGAAVVLERLAGRLPSQPLVAAVGLVLVAGGAVLHARARRALGPLWSGPVEVRAGHEVIRRGPYARVRHPIYAAFLLLAAGTLLAHPSVATGCLAVGLTTGLLAKLAIEDRTLRATLGAAYRDYARDVPALVPRRRRSPAG